MDYYSILNLDRETATHETIASAFRQLALQFHPMGSKANLDTNMRKFNQICEAYEVLSNKDHKTVFDAMGESGLKTGIQAADSSYGACGAYAYQGKCFEIFNSFFGNQSPFTDRYDLQHVEKTENDPADEKAPKDINITLNCSLYEFYNGSLKTFSYQRDKLLPDNRNIHQVLEQMTIEIKAGYDTDKVITFPSKGNEAFAYHQSKLNIHFALSNEDVNGVTINNSYVRDGDNLIYTHCLSLEDAILSKPIQVRTLDGRNINLSLDETITPQTTHVIPGEGMPRKTNSKERGDLQIRFNIKFPLNLAVANKDAIIEVLKSIETY